MLRNINIARLLRVKTNFAKTLFLKQVKEVDCFSNEIVI